MGSESLTKLHFLFIVFLLGIKMASKNRHIYEFGEFRLVPAENILEMNGMAVPLKPKAFSTLVYLVDNHGNLVEKSDLLNRIWSDSFVEEASVSKCIWELRNALNDDPKESRFIQTVPKRGYRFVAEVRVLDDEQPAQAEDGGLPLSNGHKEPSISPLAQHDIEPAEPHSLPAVEKPRSRALIAGACVLALLAVFAGYYFYQTNGSSEAAAASVAVLPLRPVNVDNRDQGLEFAIADALILKISEAKNFSVKRLFAVRKFTDLDEDPVEAGHELNVDYVLSSNYQIFDGRIRVSSQLINVRTGRAEETFRSESGVGDIFTVQDKVSNEIGNALLARFGTSVDPFVSKRGTKNEKAYSLYHEARYLVDKFTRDDSAKAVDLLDQAIDLDPNYASAWAVKAQAYCQIAHKGGGVPTELFSEAEPNLEKALAIDHNNAVALTVRGIINHDFHWDFPAAYKDLKQAIQIDPESNLAHRMLAGVYISDRRFAEGIAEQKKAVDINPASVFERWVLGLYLNVAGQRAEAIRVLDRVVEMDPNFPLGYYSLSMAYRYEGNQEKAYENFIKYKELEGSDRNTIAEYKAAYQRSGWTGVLRSELSIVQRADTKGKYSGEKFYIAGLAAQLGEKDIALDYLNEALRFHLMEISNLKADPRFDSLRSDPRFEDVLRRAGLSINS